MKRFEQANDHMGLIRACHLLLLMHWTAGQQGAAEQAVLAIIEHARAVGDRTREVRHLSALATCYTYGPTPVAEAAERSKQLLEEVGGDHKADALIRASLARLEAMRGNFDEARTLPEEPSHTEGVRMEPVRRPHVTRLRHGGVPSKRPGVGRSRAPA